jgi:hypothetical protein
LIDSAETPASIAFLSCAFHEYCASKCLAAISSDSSRSRSLMLASLSGQFASGAAVASRHDGHQS